MSSDDTSVIYHNRFDAKLLEDQMLKLSDEEFYRLVARRLNMPLSNDKINEVKIERAHEREYWLKEFLIDELFLKIAQTKEVITHHDKSVKVHKYYSQALRNWKWLPIAGKHTPEFVINITDLTPRIMAELKVLDKISYNYVNQAVCRTNI